MTDLELSVQSGQRFTATSNNARPAYRPDIDGLRAIAVLAVVAYHLFPYIVPGGYVGVDVFFVLSGFLITGVILQSLRRDTFTFPDFYARRVRRIFPALSLVLAVFFAAGWLLLSPMDYRDFGVNAAAGAGFSSNVVLWRQTNYFAPNVSFKPLLHLWSLGIEEQYYLVWPILVAVIWRWRANLIVFVAIAFVSLALCVALTPGDPTQAFYSPFARAWELLIGSMVAHVFLSHGNPVALAARLRRMSPEAQAAMSDSVSVIGLAMVISTITFLRPDSAFPGFWALGPTIGTALLICAGPSGWVNRTLLTGPLAVGIGRISYPLYLWHWPMLAFIRLVIPDAPRSTKVGIMAIAFASAYLTYRFLETPIRTRGRARTTLWLCAAQAGLLFFGIVTYAAHGFPGRFDSTHQALFALYEPDPDLMKANSSGVCELRLNQSFQDFSSQCTAIAVPHRRRVLLWGDSFAAHLAPGIRETLDSATEFHQLTAGACPPLLGYSDRRRPDCAEIARFVADWIQRNTPDVVILSAAWNAYPRYTTVAATIAMLKRAGVGRIILVGSSAQFEEPVPRLLVRQLDRNGVIPVRLTSSMTERLASIDSDLSAIAASERVRFVSPLSRQCSVQGCLVSLEGTPETVTIWDNGHLTRVGSRFVAIGLRQDLAP